MFKSAVWSFHVNKEKLCLQNGGQLRKTLLHSSPSGQRLNRAALILFIIISASCLFAFHIEPDSFKMAEPENKQINMKINQKSI